MMRHGQSLAKPLSQGRQPKTKGARLLVRYQALRDT
jgi:hypothetical protein